MGILYSVAHRRSSRRPSSLRLLLSYVYPREMYVGPTARMDLVNFLPTNLLVCPLMDVAQLPVVIALGGELATVFADGLLSSFGPVLQLSPPVVAVIALQVLLMFFGSELGVYVFHRLEHENSLLWRILSVRHSAEKLNYFTSVRDHPLETVATPFSKMIGVALCIGLVLYFAGISLHSQTTFYSGLIIVCFHGFYAGHSHSHLPISFGPLLNILIGGPVMHRIQHRTETYMFNKNYGIATNVYDWLFGALSMPKRGEKYRLGLDEDECGVRNPHQTARDFHVKPVAQMLAISKSEISSPIQRII
jgi:sterol desaturase/sphingolipid hydroxylase (fatty acid hydroxylase superfamily)